MKGGWESSGRRIGGRLLSRRWGSAEGGGSTRSLWARRAAPRMGRALLRRSPVYQKPGDFTLRAPAGVRLRAGGIWVPERRVEQLPPPTAQRFSKPFAWETPLALLWPTLPALHSADKEHENAGSEPPSRPGNGQPPVPAVLSGLGLGASHPPPVWTGAEPGDRNSTPSRSGGCSRSQSGHAQWAEQVFGLGSRKLLHHTPTLQLKLPLPASGPIGPGAQISHPQLFFHWLPPRFYQFGLLHWLKSNLRS